MEYQTSLFRGQPDDEAIKMIQFYEGLAVESDPRGYCVCTSEGKDSRVLGHLMRRAGVKHFYKTNITGIDPPELTYFRRHNFAEYNDLGYLTYAVAPSIPFFELCRKKRILPLRTHRFCCEHLKERATVEDGTAIMCLGVRKAESSNRNQKRNELEVVTGGKRGNIIMPFDNDENRRQFEVCYADNLRRVNPIAYWTDADIWNYSKDVGLEQCSLYYEGFDRLGCIGCPMARKKGRELEFNRWKGFKRLYILTIERIIADRVSDGIVVQNKTFADAHSWFNWWMSDKAQDETDETQLTLFGLNEVEATP